jgi:hypothetical protein
MVGNDEIIKTPPNVGIGASCAAYQWAGRAASGLAIRNKALICPRKQSGDDNAGALA